MERVDGEHTQYMHSEEEHSPGLTILTIIWEKTTNAYVKVCLENRNDIHSFHHNLRLI